MICDYFHIDFQVNEMSSTTHELENKLKDCIHPLEPHLKVLYKNNSLLARLYSTSLRVRKRELQLQLRLQIMLQWLPTVAGHWTGA